MPLRFKDARHPDRHQNFLECSGKRRDRPYRGGRSPHWIKVKNRTHAAMERVRESF
jgi:hypothetical protein